MRVTFPHSSRGFSLIETLVAAGILVTAFASLAQLVGWSVHQARESDRRSRSLVAAREKLEQLRAAAWTVDLQGVTVSDAALNVSPPGSLDSTIGGSFDWVDAAGQSGPPGTAVVQRRWAIAIVNSAFPETISLEVCAFGVTAASAPRTAADACVWTVRVRQP